MMSLSKRPDSPESPTKEDQAPPFEARVYDAETASQEFVPLERRLKSRHITMIAIGGVIGPGQSEKSLGRACGASC